MPQFVVKIANRWHLSLYQAPRSPSISPISGRYYRCRTSKAALVCITPHCLPAYTLFNFSTIKSARRISFLSVADELVIDFFREACFRVDDAASIERCRLAAVYFLAADCAIVSSISPWIGDMPNRIWRANIRLPHAGGYRRHFMFVKLLHGKWHIDVSLYVESGNYQH